MNRPSDVPRGMQRMVFAAILAEVFYPVGAAWAQNVSDGNLASIPIDRWNPSTGHDGIANVEGVPERAPILISAWLVLASRPLVVANARTTTTVVSTMGTLHGSVDAPLLPWLRIAAGMRTTVWSNGQTDAATGISPDLACTSQIRIGLRARLTPEAYVWSLGLTGWTAIGLPNTAPTAEGVVVLGIGRGAWRFALNAGARYDTPGTLGNYTWGPTAFARAGLRIMATRPITLWASVSGGTGLGSAVFFQRAETFGEVSGGVDIELLGGLAFQVGGGTGITYGVGTPTFRGLLNFRWSVPVVQHRPAPQETTRRVLTVQTMDDAVISALDRDRDSDGDGVPDRRDQCVTLPEDFDGVLDQDGCPDPDPGPDPNPSPEVVIPSHTLR